MERLTRKSQSSEMVWFIDHDNNGLNLEPCEMSYSNNGKAIRKLAYYEDAEEQGRLVILPCKVGDSYFTYSWGCHGSHDDCFEYDDCDECPHLKREIRECKFKNVVHILNAEKDFGKSIFLSREEAEAAIRGG